MVTPRPGPRLTPESNPANARWCPDHGRMECTRKRKRGGDDCHGPAIRGTDTCKMHSGKSRQEAVVSGEVMLSAWSAVGKPTQSLDPGAAVMSMLQQAWLRAHAYGELMRQQVAAQGMEGTPEHFDPEEPVKTSGLIGYRFGAAGKDGTIYAVSEEIRALVSLENAERDRVVKYAKVAHDMGISDRMTSLAERWADLVVNRIMTVMDGLNLTPEQEALVPALIEAHLGSIDLGGSAQ